MLHMREQLLRALLAHAQGDIAKHKANVEIYLEHPAGIGAYLTTGQLIPGYV